MPVPRSMTYADNRSGQPGGQPKFRIAHCASWPWDEAVIRGTLSIIEIAVLSALILATRCANYQNVFVAGNIYFTDADCYARMTRVRMCAEHPGLILRHHDFENFPQGTTPHTTAPPDSRSGNGTGSAGSSVIVHLARHNWRLR